MQVCIAFYYFTVFSVGIQRHNILLGIGNIHIGISLIPVVLGVGGQSSTFRQNNIMWIAGVTDH